MTILIPQYRTARRASAAGRPLDDYTANLWMAASTRKLLTSYAGNSMNLNRLVGGGSQLVGFVDNILDTATVATFGSGTTAYPVTVYDQSGNSRNLTSPSTTAVYKSGAQVVINSMPAMLFDSTAAYLQISTRPAQFTAFVTCYTIAKKSVMWSVNGTASAYVAVSEDGSSSAHNSNSGTSNCYVDGTVTGSTRNDLYDAAMGTPALHVIAATASSTASWSLTTMQLGGYTVASFDMQNLKVVDVVIYDTVLSASDISAISSKLIAGI